MATASKKMPLISAISLYIVATQKSQSVENNTSTIEYEAYLYNPNYTYYYAWNGATMVVKVDGSTVKTLNNIQYDFRSGSRKQCVASGTTTVNHSSDGTKNLTASVQVTFPSAHPGAGNETVSVSFNLTTIPRKTEVTSVANLTINEAATTLSVGLSRKSASFTHVLALSVNGVNIPDWTTSSHNFTGTQSCSISLTKAREILSAMPTKVTATLTVTCTTKNASGTVIGSHSASSTCTVNSAVKPSITGASVTASTPAGAISGRSRSYAVKGVSNLSVNYSPSAGYGSTLQSVTVVMNGVSKSENPASFPASASGTNTATITATDKRGRTTTATPSISVVDYSPLTAQVTNLDRQSANNGRMTLSVKVTTSQILYGGATTNGYEIKATAQPVGGGATTTPVNDKVTTGYLTASTQTYNPTTSYSETTAYNVTITIKDDYSSATIQGTLSTASYPLVIGKYGIGVGKVPQGDRVLDVGGTIYADDILLGGESLSGGTTYNIALENGWTGSLQCKKNKLGQVSVNGSITPGTVENGTLIAQLPHSPKNALAFAVYDSGSGLVKTPLAIFATGRIYVQASSGNALIAGRTINFETLFQEAFDAAVTVFRDIPQPPYKQGDLWHMPELTVDYWLNCGLTVDQVMALGFTVEERMGGHSYVCTTSRTSGNFNRSDWKLTGTAVRSSR
jgi:hypothetical protein